ncbi:transposase IS200 family protein [Prosthecobacter fusiformis]|uniref:Transposase IS200 family protein n=1 Tax=Prosthecobacter fusiformis TaxID=48464 RepID=A0A4R7RMP8_9BACT|nr:glycosyltransferase [Prosthecobacter fusiformis]TDU64254.1 transposase IS200 family protein [Prosthecobacter fusiformis]
MMDRIPPMRIALLHYTLPPVIGGVERVIRDQAAALEALGHEVEVFDRSADALVRFRKVMEAANDPGVRAPSPATQQPRSSLGRLSVSASDPCSIKNDSKARSRTPLQRVKEWINHADTGPYFEPAKEIEKHRHGLPHWQQAGKLVFLTWRLADALPQEKLNELRGAKASWEAAHPKPWTVEESEAFDQIFDAQVEHWLAADMGACVLRQWKVREPLRDTLHHGDGHNYDLLSYVIMPNHVHVLFRLRPGSSLESVIQAWKSISSRRIGKILGQMGGLWQEGYRDTLIRGPEHLQRVLHYIEKNPKEASLLAGNSEFWQCGPVEGSGHTVEDEIQSGRGRPRSRNEADEGVRTPYFQAVIVHNVFTMPFDLEWTKELREMAELTPDIRWFNWVHDVAAVNPFYAHLPWQREDHAMLSQPVPNAINITVSEARRQDYMRATGLEKEQIQVIPNGLHLASILGLTERIAGLRLWDRELILVHPTRLIRRKNIELGLEVTASLRKAGCDVIYAITGAPDPHQADGMLYYQELKALVERLDISRHVLFLGEEEPVSDEDVRSLYTVADALFFPSTGEGFGLPLLEATAHRLTVFCSNLSVHYEVLGEAGEYFSIQSKPDEISARIMQWYPSATVNHQRRHLWRRHEMVKICQEHLEPLLVTANQST